MPAKDQVGLTGPTYEVDIERGKIREFARAMNAPIDDFVTGQVPVIPATFIVSAPYTWGYTLERPRGTVFAEIDHDLSVPLHAEESIIFHGEPPRAGARLTAQSSLETVREKTGRSGGAMTFLTILTQYRDAEGKVMIEQRSTTVTTGQSPGSGSWDTQIPDYKPDYKELDPVDPFLQIPRQDWEDLVEGQGPGSQSTGPLLLCDIIRFQGVVGEDNPLHHDTVWAKAFDFPTVFGLGTHQASVLAAYAAHWIDPAKVRAMHIRFCGIYWPGDELTYEGSVISKSISETGERKVELSLQCKRNESDVVVQVKMTCVF